MADISILERFEVEAQGGRRLAAPQPPPAASDGPVVLDLLIETLRARSAAGELKYGTKLRAFNGRDALVDLLQELADGCMYVMQAIAERNAAHGASEHDTECTRLEKQLEDQAMAIHAMGIECGRLEADLKTCELERDQAREAADQWAAECKALKAQLDHLHEQLRRYEHYRPRAGGVRCTLPENHTGPCELRGT